MNRVEISRNFKKIKIASKIKQCLHPNQEECSERIIGAHSISNSKVLKLIADEGCVYMPYPKSSDPYALVTKWGRREATVFNGFCGYHDNELFRAIENYDFNKSKEQIFFHTYRCLAVGLHRQMESINFEEILLVKRSDITTNKGLESEFIGERGTVRDLKYCKSILDKGILEEKYDMLSSIVWEFDKIIKFAASGFKVIRNDLRGRPLIKKENELQRMYHLYFTVFPEGEKSYCILSWLSEADKTIQNYIQQLYNLNEEEKIAYLNNMIPMQTENIVINPSGWEELEANQKEEFGELMWYKPNLPKEANNSYNLLKQPSFNLFEL